MMIACYQARDSKPRLLLLSHELSRPSSPCDHHGAAAEGVPSGVAARQLLARCSPRVQAMV